MTVAGVPGQQDDAEWSEAPLACAGAACAVAGAAAGGAVGKVVAVAAPDWLDCLLRKEISDQFDTAGARAPHAG